jgi:biotin carboxyl carrier protein
MLKVTTNELSFFIKLENDQLVIDENLWNGDLLKVGENLYHLIKDSKSYLVELLAAEKKSVQLKINGTIFEVAIQDRHDQLLEKLGMQQSNDSGSKDVRAPMPGMILEVLVEKGQTVAKGDKLLILEAMKMENIIKSDGDGVIQEVPVEKGMNVEKNQVLIQF